MKRYQRIIAAALLLALLIPSAVACGSGKDSGEPAQSETTAAQSEAETTAPDPLAGIDLEGIEVRISTSVDTTDSTNANALIEGTGEENGEIANDAVYARNAYVEELLNVKLAFTETQFTYSNAQSEIQKIVLSGEDAYDVIINDLFILAKLSIEGMFQNVKSDSLLDFDQNYWWKDYMEELTIGNDCMFLLAGDYFMDILCSAHALYFNKQIMENLHGGSDDLYQAVLDGKWTTDMFLSLIEGTYQDLNGNSKKDIGDMFGYTCHGTWGSAIPFMLCGDLTFVTRDADGIPTFALNNDRAVTTLEMLNQVFYNDATLTTLTIDSTLIPNFLSGLSLFCGYQRVGSFSNFRDSDFDVGVVPYPKLDEAQERYVTASHDTSELGVIPVTSSRFDATATALEALCRSTKELVIPAYYETTLKVKYARDDVSSQMLDIIHDNIRASFPVAYNNYCGNALLTIPFSDPLAKNSSDFASAVAKAQSTAETKLAEMVDAFMANNG